MRAHAQMEPDSLLRALSGRNGPFKETGHQLIRSLSSFAAVLYEVNGVAR